MSLRVCLIDGLTGDAVHLQDVRGEDQPLLVTTSIPEAHGLFASATRVGAGTSVLVTPGAGGAIVLTDLLISTDKVNNATVNLSFTDGSDSVSVFNGNVTDAPLALAVGLTAAWRGWADARVEMTTTNAVNATIAVGYVRVRAGLSFSDWDAQR